MTKDQIKMLKAVYGTIATSIRPASDDAIALEMETLALNYPGLHRTVEEHDSWAACWLEDLADYPADLIAEACRLWRNAPLAPSKEPRFPLPGQFKALVDPVLAVRRRLLERCGTALRLVDEKRPAG